MRRRTVGAGVVALAAAAIAAPAAVSPAHPGEAGERYVSVEWTRPSDDTSRGRRIRVRYAYGGYVCQYRFHRAAARETERSVTIKVLAHRREMRQDEACIAIAGGGETTVKLEKPLGDRRLRHAKVNDPQPGAP